MNIVVRHVEPSDASRWKAFRTALWPEGAHEHAAEIAAFFAHSIPEPQAVLVAASDRGTIVGLAELSIRYDIPGLQGRKTGYVEGLYLDPSIRGQGLARTLLQAARSWARDQQCSAFASDREERTIVDPSF